MNDCDKISPLELATLINNIGHDINVAFLNIKEFKLQYGNSITLINISPKTVAHVLILTVVQPTFEEFNTKLTSINKKILELQKVHYVHHYPEVLQIYHILEEINKVICNAHTYAQKSFEHKKLFEYIAHAREQSNYYYDKHIEHSSHDLEHHNVTYKYYKNGESIPYELCVTTYYYWASIIRMSQIDYKRLSYIVNDYHIFFKSYKF